MIVIYKNQQQSIRYQRHRKYAKAFLEYTSSHGICQIYFWNGAFIGTILTLYIIHCTFYIIQLSNLFWEWCLYWDRLNITRYTLYNVHYTLYICQIYSRNGPLLGPFEHYTAASPLWDFLLFIDSAATS